MELLALVLFGTACTCFGFGAGAAEQEAENKRPRKIRGKRLDPAAPITVKRAEYRDPMFSAWSIESQFKAEANKRGGW